MIGKKLTRLRKLNGFTQLELARRLGTSCKSVKNWEADISDPSLKNLAALCCIFHISADYLLGLESDFISLQGLDSKHIRILKSIVQAYVDTVANEQE